MIYCPGLVSYGHGLDHCLGCNALGEQLAQRTAAIQEHLRQHDHQLNGDPDCMCVVCEILQPLRNALADLSDVPRVEP